jgi:hypothetical protein
VAYAKEMAEEENFTMYVDFAHLDEEARNTPLCPSQEKFHTFVLRGLRNISEAP